MTQITKTASELTQRIRHEAVMRKTAAIMKDDKAYCYIMQRYLGIAPTQTKETEKK